MTDTRAYSRPSRRQFVASAAAVAGAAGLAGVLPESLQRAAAAVPPRQFDLSQVRHVVLLMQENRSFDHYFGTFPGARGFDDPAALRLPGGSPVFRQPDPGNPDGYVEPFHISTVTSGAAAVPSLSHDWRDQHASWNFGSMDRWVRTHTAADGVALGTYTMGYYTRQDIPFHWALAESFTLLDRYHCSVLGPTYPNRLLWQTGTLDPQGLAGGPLLQTAGPPRPFTWPTSAEILYSAGYGVKVYYSDSGGQGLNMLPLFASFQSAGTLPDGLFQNTRTQSTVWGSADPSAAGAPASPQQAADPALAFEQDCAGGTLADVSWIMAGAAQEHPPDLPALGAQFIASKLEALAANEDLWNSTVFILNYDENDGFFDHVLPPTPRRAEYPEEFVDLVDVVGVPGGGLPVGAGFRVPCLVISPWTVGGGVYSELTDHTSALLFLEKLTAAGGLSGHGPVTFPLVSRWRRDTFGDFTGVLQPGRDQPLPAAIESIIASTDPGAMSNGQTIAQYVASQQQAGLLPLPPFPGRQQPGRRPEQQD